MKNIAFFTKILSSQLLLNLFLKNKKVCFHSVPADKQKQK